MKTNKKGQLMPFDALGGLVLPLIVIGMVLMIGLVIMSEMKDQHNDVTGCCLNATQYYNASMGVCCKYSCNGTHCVSAPTGGNVSLPNCSANAYNHNLVAGCEGLSDVQSAMSSIPGWLSIFVIVIIGGVLLALIALFRNR